jgi:hypothetical protein
VYRRGDRRNLPEILNEIFNRLRKVEETASRRALPAGYFWTVNAGQLVIERESDGTQQVIF